MSKFEFIMPKLGESITEAAIITWFKKEGDFVKKDEMLLEVATDKVDSEVPSTVSGTVSKILYSPNDVIKIGEVIAVIDINGVEEEIESDTLDSEIAQKQIKPVSREKVKSPKPKPAQIAGRNNNAFYSPLIISIAKQEHISFDELARIPASGKDGRLRKSDLHEYIKAGRPYKFAQSGLESDPGIFRLPNLNLNPGEGERIEMDRMRRMISDHMVYSVHTSPHVTAYAEADLTDLVNWRSANKEKFLKTHKQKLTLTPLFIEAVTHAIQDFPMINVSVDGYEIIRKDDINIGMATALPDGNLIVPVIRNADKKNLVDLSTEVNALTDKARSGDLSADDIGGSTFTISNVGTFGSLMGTPIINQPEVAILALGVIKKRPQVIETEKGDEIQSRRMMYLSLSFDHRVVDGYLGGSFLRSIADNLEKFDIKRTL